MYTHDSKAALNATKFISNTGGYGAGIEIEGPNADVAFFDCSFINNTALGGSGLTVNNGSRGYVEKCNFTGNSASRNGIFTFSLLK